MECCGLQPRGALSRQMKRCGLPSPLCVAGLVCLMGLAEGARLCYSCNQRGPSLSCPRNATTVSVSEEYSCMVWQEAGSNNILRQSFILSTECSRHNYWAAFIKHKYGMAGSMECCNEDLCNKQTGNQTQVTTTPASGPTDQNTFDACSKSFLINGTESLVPFHFIALGDEATNQSSLPQLRRRRRHASPDQLAPIHLFAGVPPAEAVAATEDGLTSTVSTEPKFRLNSVQLILPENDVIKFLAQTTTTTAASPSLPILRTTSSEVASQLSAMQTTATSTLKPEAAITTAKGLSPTSIRSTVALEASQSQVATTAKAAPLLAITAKPAPQLATAAKAAPLLAITAKPAPQLTTAAKAASHLQPGTPALLNSAKPSSTTTHKEPVQQQLSPLYITCLKKEA